MLEVFKKIWAFSGVESRKLKKSIMIGFFFALFNMFQIGALYFVLVAIIENKQDYNPLWVSLIFMLISIIGRIMTHKVAQLQRTHAGYFMVANKRILIGNKLKNIPMGYFNGNSLGQITGITTTVLDEVENTVPVILVNTLGGFINAIIFTLYICIFDLRIGLIVIVGSILYLLAVSAMEKKSVQVTAFREKSQANLVESVLEAIQGMSIIRSFNLSKHNNQKVDRAIIENRDTNIKVENLFTPYAILQGLILKVFSVLIMMAAIYFYLNGSMQLTYCLMMIIVSFLIFVEIETAGSSLAVLRIASTAIEHANQIDDIAEMDVNGSNFHPTKHDICFNHVSFSYDEREILHDIHLVIPNQTTTAIVGPSGSGKTTICNLIARFWDVNKGSITIGGKDVRTYTLESLMAQISMVFQDVYLFNDTIENNIKFGMPNATHEQVCAAAKKACCDDFIEALPNGYQTIIGEGGSSLSGGEKQRISIARAILKDAPIVILDEATANVDPENEDRLQKAIESLTRNKTIIMIAHRLKTVRHADQILVVDQGQIVQRGTHDDLITQEGIYKNFINARHEAIGWRIR